MKLQELKQGMSQVFTRIESRSATGEMPEISDVLDLVRLSRKFQLTSSDEYGDELTDFVYLAEQLEKAVKGNELENSILLVTSLQEAMTYCHRMYKE